MKLFLIATILALAACGREYRSPPQPTIPRGEPRIPHEEPPIPLPRPEPQVCWEELRCQNVKVKTRQGFVTERICYIQKVCEALMTTENTRRGI